MFQCLKCGNLFETALQVALQRPELLRSLVLCGTTPGGRTAIPPEKKFMLNFIRCFDGWNDEDLQADGNKVIAERFMNATHLPEQLSGDQMNILVKRYLKNTKRLAGISGQAAALSRFDVFKKLGTVKVPTLILQGKHDKVIPFENAELLHQGIKGSRLVQQESGHLWQMTNVEFIDTIFAFLKEIKHEETR